MPKARNINPGAFGTLAKSSHSRPAGEVSELPSLNAHMGLDNESYSSDRDVLTTRGLSSENSWVHVSPLRIPL